LIGELSDYFPALGLKKAKNSISSMSDISVKAKFARNLRNLDNGEIILKKFFKNEIFLNFFDYSGEGKPEGGFYSYSEDSQKNIATHELGHALGFCGHASGMYIDVMYQSMNGIIELSFRDYYHILQLWIFMTH
jgi:hypothetical protein